MYIYKHNKAQVLAWLRIKKNSNYSWLYLPWICHIEKTTISVLWEKSKLLVWFSLQDSVARANKYKGIYSRCSTEKQKNMKYDLFMLMLIINLPSQKLSVSVSWKNCKLVAQWFHQASIALNNHYCKTPVSLYCIDTKENEIRIVFSCFSQIFNEKKQLLSFQ